MQIRRVIDLCAFLTMLYIFLDTLIIGFGLKNELNHRCYPDRNSGEICYLNRPKETEYVLSMRGLQNTYQKRVCIGHNKGITKANYLSFGTVHCERAVVDNAVYSVYWRIERYTYRKFKKTQRSCSYYPNSCASRQILLQDGNTSINPGPTTQCQHKKNSRAPRCI